MLTPFELKEALGTLTILADTREHPTKLFKERLKATGYPYERFKLDAGDYSAKVRALDREINLQNVFAIERKMDLDELAMCFGKERPRFTREFERMKAVGTRCYLLVEGATWEKAFNGQYSSLMAANALTASMLAWQVRYNTRFIFCEPKTSGKLIGQICYREAKEYLETLKE